MKRFILLPLLLVACQPSVEGEETPRKAVKTEISERQPEVKSGVVRLRINPTVSEPLACIIPISVENGLSAPTRVTLIAFNLSGPGEDGRGNMFAPVAAPGEISEARVIVEGQSCDAFDTLSVPEVRCTSSDESCAEKVEFIDGETLRFSQAG
jgi:hypothetical protein